MKTKQYILSGLILTTLLYALNAAADPVSIVHCKIKQQTLLDQPMYDQASSKGFQVTFTCQENLEKLFQASTNSGSPNEALNSVNYNKITSQLIPAAFTNQQELTLGMTSSFSSAIVTINGVSVQFDDESTVIPAVPRPRATMLPQERWLLSGSPLLNLAVEHQISFDTSSGYHLSTNSSGVVVTGETGQSLITYVFVDPSDLNNTIGSFSGDVAAVFIGKLKSAGMATTVWAHTIYGAKHVSDEFLQIQNDDINGVDEYCRQRTDLDTMDVTTSCTFVSKKTVL